MRHRRADTRLWGSRTAIRTEPSSRQATPPQRLLAPGSWLDEGSSPKRRRPYVLASRRSPARLGRAGCRVCRGSLAPYVRWSANSPATPRTRSRRRRGALRAVLGRHEQPDQALQPGPLPSCGSSVARPAVAIKSARPGENTDLRTYASPPAGPAGDAHATLEPSADQAPEFLT